MSMKSTKSIKRIGLAAAGLVATGVVVFGAASLASAETTSPSPSASATTGSGDSGKRGSNDAAVTGEELAKVTAAMKAKDSAVTVSKVRKDSDGSYDVLGTKDGTKVFYEVSADLKTFTLHTGHGDHRGRDRDSSTAVTGEELAKVTAAMKTKDSAVTVTKVRKDSDGSYHVLGTKDGTKVFYHVSADLKTFTLHTGHGDHGTK
ncbi:hypothetical protein [Dactylosporangium sp. CA-139066]|uniref:hypothetical protein n=1 Tax=Dactylosporangium sp. CA-139066 TaxID=3239930 RepID=UPI003D8B3227